MLYKCFQLYHAIPNQWKRVIKNTNDLCTNIVNLSHHLVKNNRTEQLPQKNFTQKKFTQL